MHRAVRKAEFLLVGLLFMGFLCIPGLGPWLQLDAGLRTRENRTLAALPDAPADRVALLAFPRMFAKFIDDHFGFRDRLIRYNSLFKMAWLGVSPTPDVVLGKDGWLFLGRDVYDRGFHVIEDFRRLDPYTPEALERAVNILEERAAWSQARGIRYLFVLMPNKSTIYPEFMPAHITRVGRSSRIDQLVMALNQRRTVDFIDLRATLSAAKRHDRVYDKTGTHWNGIGAFAADGAIATRLATWFPAVRPHSAANVQRRASTRPGSGLARLLGLQDLYPETHLWLELPHYRTRYSRDLFRPPYPLFHEPFATESDDRGLPAAVVFHDSSVLAIRRYLAEHFSRGVYYWQYDFSPSLVERESPDLVLQLIGERSLSNGPPENPPALQAEAPVREVVVRTRPVGDGEVSGPQ